MFVKICGITNETDARVALEAGADAIGLIMADSPRRVDPAVASRIVAALHGAPVLTVGVFRRQAPGDVLDLARTTGVGSVQVHAMNRAEVDALRPLIPFLIEAVPAAGAQDAAASPADLMLVDAVEPGSGRTFDWSVLGDLPSRRRILLAGGLTADNVEDAVRLVRPYGVDVASGVEARPGIKDPEKVRRFVARARQQERPVVPRRPTASPDDVGS